MVQTFTHPLKNTLPLAWTLHPLLSKVKKLKKTFNCTIALLISKLRPYSTDVGRKHIQFSALQLFLSNEKKTFMCMEQLLSHSPPFVTFLQKRPFIWCCCLKFTAEGAFCVAAKYSCRGLLKLRGRQNCYFSDSDIPPLCTFYCIFRETT